MKHFWEFFSGWLGIFDVGFDVVLDFGLQNRLHVVLDPHLKIKNPLKIKGLGVVFADWTVSS